VIVYNRDMRGIYFKTGLAAICVASWATGCAADDALFNDTGEVAGSGGATSTTSTGSTSSSSTTSSVGAGGSGQGGSGAGTTSSGTGGGTSDNVGCSDGTREHYDNQTQRPSIAGCAGGFQVAGVTTQQSRSPQCNRQAGNDSGNPGGVGCSVADLCSEGWHVCADAAEVATSGAGCEASTSTTPEFWLTRQVQTSQGVCAGSPNVNNITGCGNIGYLTQSSQGCAPLERSMRYVECQGSPSWDCGDITDNLSEAEVVTKSQGGGGVLCCRQ
jgi:hypothetical protein